MDDTFLVRVLHRVADALDQPEARAQIEVVLLAVRLQVGPVDVLHREERVFADRRFERAGFIDLRDARMVQPAEDVGFHAETAQPIARDVRGMQDLERDASSRRLLQRLVHHAHTALAELAGHGIVTDAIGHPAARLVDVVEQHRLERASRLFDALVRERVVRVRRGEERLELLPQLVIVARVLGQERRALLRSEPRTRSRTGTAAGRSVLRRWPWSASILTDERRGADRSTPLHQDRLSQVPKKNSTETACEVF